MKIGEYNELKVLRFTSIGAYLGDEDGNDVLFPYKYIPPGLQEDDSIRVFIYRDSEDRVIATSEMPYITRDGFAFLEIKDVNLYGAFADWGLEKDLLIPFKEQKARMEAGKSYLICLQLDEATDRVYGTGKIQKHLQPCEESFEMNDEVDLLVWEQSNMGYKVIVNNKYQGLIFNNFIDREIQPGQEIKGYVLQVREDGKLDIRISPAGYAKVPDSAEKLLSILQKRGKLSLTDKSDPEDIREAVGMSKKTFKQAVGSLYKQKLIVLNADNIELVNKD